MHGSKALPLLALIYPRCFLYEDKNKQCNWKILNTYFRDSFHTLYSKYIRTTNAECGKKTSDVNAAQIPVCVADHEATRPLFRQNYSS